MHLSADEDKLGRSRKGGWRRDEDGKGSGGISVEGDGGAES